MRRTGWHQTRARGSAFAGEADMAVMEFLDEGDGEGEAHALDEVLLLVAIEDEGVDHADRTTAGVEVEAHHEGEPLARPGRWRGLCRRRGGLRL